ncbi:hypothetical protein F4780DRAFT_44112 [Xylariomycetidae sp. FL0641]|nr:hypothetical protein F4780DRAFT_44112 [Xylariomycetidae sp. FL0641]
MSSGLGPTVGSPHANTRGPALLAVSATTSVLALLTCLLRYCVKTRISRRVAWDDYFVGLAMLLGAVGACFTIVEAGSPDEFGQRQRALQFDFLAQPWLNMGSALAKVSICLFMLRLVARVRLWRAVLGVQVMLLLLVNLAYSFATLLQCRPLEKLWRPAVAGRCWGLGTQQDIGYFQGAFDVFSQLFIALFPIMIIRDLAIPRNVRWPFYMLSVMSIIIAMLAVLRTYNISLIQKENRYMFQSIATILAVLEQNLGIVSANILPIASLSSKNIRPISEALSQAASARDTDTASILSKKPGQMKRRQSTGSTFLIEGPQRASYDGGASSVMLDLSEGSGSGGAVGGRRVGTPEAFPMGIIKTVSVEVVKEDAVDVERGMDLSEDGRVSRQQDWDSYLR